MNNSRSDRFASGAAEGQHIVEMDVAELKKLPSGDAPGKTVAAVLPAKRLSQGHRLQVLAMKAGAPIEPVTIRAGALVDGHHRVAAAEDAGRRVPARRFPL